MVKARSPDQLLNVEELTKKWVYRGIKWPGNCEVRLGIDNRVPLVGKYMTSKSQKLPWPAAIVVINSIATGGVDERNAVRLRDAPDFQVTLHPNTTGGRPAASF